LSKFFVCFPPLSNFDAMGRPIYMGGGISIGGLTKTIKEIPDPRRAWGNLRHKLEDIFVIGLAAFLCGGEDFEDMEQFGLSWEEELRKFLELPHGCPMKARFSG
jgi:hypothetical protein